MNTHLKRMSFIFIKKQLFNHPLKKSKNNNKRDNVTIYQRRRRCHYTI